jgi:putative ABC transport system permease protein
MQFTYGWRIYFVRAVGDPAALIPEIRRAIHAVEPDLAMTEVQPLGELIGASWSRQRFDARFFGSVALLALLLAISGIYSVVTYAAGRRTREIGIRMALGGRPADIVRLVVRDGMRAPLIGLVLGTGAAFAAAGLLRASLYGVAPTDARILSMTLTLLLVSALIACVIPARRATQVDPCEALRTD